MFFKSPPRRFGVSLRSPEYQPLLSQRIVRKVPRGHGMRVRKLMTRRPAPETGTQLNADQTMPVSLDGLGAPMLPPATSPIPPVAQPERQPAAPQAPNVWETITGGINSLVSAYTTYEGAKDDRRAAERRAEEARRQAEHDRRLALLANDQATWEEEMARRVAASQPAQTGMPGWVMPTVLVGGGGLLLLVALRMKKR